MSNARKNGGHQLRFRDKCVEKYPNFEKLAHETQHGLQGFKLKILKMSQERQPFLSYFVEVRLSKQVSAAGNNLKQLEHPGPVAP